MELKRTSREGRPTVSIVLPVHNGARYLSTSIESCIEQTLASWELIIVDDASSDESPAIAARYAGLDPRIRVVTHATNVKLPAALNSGFARATGRYLTWTSDDNLYRPDALMEMVAFLDGRPDVGLVYCDCTIVDDEGREIRHRTVPDWDLALELNPVGACFLYRADVMNSVGTYSEDLFLCEDFDYWLRISAKYRVEPLHRDLYLYRHHEKSLTARRQAEIQVALHKALRRNLPALQYMDKARRAETYYVMAGRAWNRRALGETLECVLLSFRTSPSWFLSRMNRKISSR